MTCPGRGGGVQFISGPPNPRREQRVHTGGGGGGWHKASVSDCLPLAAPIGLSPLLILTLCGPERVLVVSTEPPDDLSCSTTPGVGRPGDGLLPVPLTRGIQMHTLSPRGVCRLQQWGGGGFRTWSACCGHYASIRTEVQAIIFVEAFCKGPRHTPHISNVKGGGGVPLPHWCCRPGTRIPQSRHAK